MQTSYATKPEEQLKATHAVEKLGLGQVPESNSGAGAGLPLFLRSAGVQAKMTVDEPGDEYESEAEQVAQAVVNEPSQDTAESATQVSNLPYAEGQISNSTEASLLVPDTAGEPLPSDVQQQLETRMGVDLSHVRLHQDLQAQTVTEQLHARALTHRSDIWLGPGESPQDLHLMAHEATHVIQQGARAGAVDSTPTIQRTPTDTATAPSMEIAASSTPETPSAEPQSSPSDSAPDSRGNGSAGTGSVGSATRRAAGPQRDRARSGTPQGTGGRGGAATARGEARVREVTVQAAAQQSVEEQIESQLTPHPTAESESGELETSDLVLIDLELAEHQRWANAIGRTGEMGSIERAALIAEAVGSGLTSGAASGFGMGLTLGLAARAVPAVGAIVGGGMALHGLIHRDWTETGATIARFGEGSDVYETLANTIASVATVIEIVSQILSYINGVAEVVRIAALVIAGGATVAAFLTFGATAGIAIMAGEVAVTCTEISEAIMLVTTALDVINAAVLQPCVVLFRALHMFTTQADPREVEAQGSSLSTAAATSGAVLGGWIGGRAAHARGAPRQRTEETPPAQHPPHETPPPAAGEGPAVHFEQPGTAGQQSAHGSSSTTPEQLSLAGIEGAPAPGAHAEAAPLATEAVPARPMEQLSLPNMEGPSSSAPRPPHPDEIAPADAHSAWLRRLRAEAEGGPPPAGPGTDPYNIARHHVPGQNTAHPDTPTPDLYQSSPRPHGEQSHHLEQQAALARSIEGYNPNEDVTVNMPVGEHRATFAPQAQQRANRAALDASLGTPAALQEGVNIAMWGETSAPQAGSGRVPMVPEHVAGQTAMEHSGYLFERTPLSSAHGGEGRPTAADILEPHGGTMGHEDIDWGRTFNQPDPHVLAAPPGTQLSLAGIEAPAPRPSTPEQLSLRFPEAPNPNQLSLPLEGSATSGGAPRPVHEPSVIVDEAALGLEPGSVTTTDPGRLHGPERAPTDVDWSRLGSTDAERFANLRRLEEHPTQQEYDPSLPHGPFRGERGMTTTDPHTGQRVYEPEAFFELTPDHPTFGVRAGPGGAWVDHVFATRAEAEAYAARQAAQGEAQIRSQSALPHDWPPDATGRVWPGNPVDQFRVFEVPPNQPTIRSVVAPQPEGSPAPGRPSVYPGGGPQTQLPRGVIHRESVPLAEYPIPRDPSSGGTPPSPSGAPPALTPPAVPNTGPTVLPAVRPPSTTPASPENLGAGSAAAPAARTVPTTPGSPPSGRASLSWGARTQQTAQMFLPLAFGSGGEGPTYEQRQAEHRARFTSDNQPATGVERVNPEYPPPPATMQQIIAIQNHILNVLAARARAEQETERQNRRIERCEENQEPIQQSVRDTTAGISAVQAHEQAVAQREAANNEQQRRQQETEALVAGYPSRATGLTALSVPLAAWEGFTDLASHLPGSAGDKMLEMNREARRMQDAFGQMGAQMIGVDSAGPARQAELQNDESRLTTTGEQARASEQQLRTANAGAIALREENQAAQSEAVQARDAATAEGEQLAATATQEEQQADLLSSQLREWSVAHRAAREQAIESTRQRLTAEGNVVIRSTQ